MCCCSRIRPCDAWFINMSKLRPLSLICGYKYGNVDIVKIVRIWSIPSGSMSTKKFTFFLFSIGQEDIQFCPWHVQCFSPPFGFYIGKEWLKVLILQNLFFCRICPCRCMQSITRPQFSCIYSWHYRERTISASN